MNRFDPTVLIIEDGDEYRENLSRFVEGPVYLQAHGGREAVELMAHHNVDIIYLDMRFDRVPNGALVGDHVRATRDHNGDPLRGWKFLQNNQGLFILELLREEGFGDKPVILAYDFMRQERRYEHLRKIHPTLKWIGDTATPATIREMIYSAWKPTARA